MPNRSSLPQRPIHGALGNCNVALDVFLVSLALPLELLLQLMALMPVVQQFDRLLEADGDDKPDHDGDDVDDEVFPGVRGFVRRVYIEHRTSDLSVQGP